MKVDYLIKNGRVIDPERNIDEIRTIAVSGNKIVSADNADEAMNTIDASGCIVTPGLIDYHTHIFQSGAFSGTNPTLFAAYGVTATVDAGTAGSANFEAFYMNDVMHSPLRIKSYILPFSAGQVSFDVPENYDPSRFNRRKIKALFETYPDQLLGLKIKFSKGILPEDEELAMAYLRGVVDLANEIEGCRVCVHVTDAAAPAAKIAEVLREGDIYCHCYNGRGYHIYDENGEMYAAIKEARDRGVLFDASNGFSNFSLKVADKAIKEGFTPDIISTDNTSMHANRPGFVKNLPYVMSKYLAFGMELPEIIKAVTSVPAAAMNMQGKIGTLQEGAFADIAIFKIMETEVTFKDILKDTYHGKELIIPQFTLLDGNAVYCQTDFWNE